MVHSFHMNPNIAISRLCYVVRSIIVAQSVVSQAADPGVTSSIPAQAHTFVEIDNEIISTVVIDQEIISMVIILLPLFKNRCCQLQAKVCAQNTCLTA